ncbi:MAG TPA: hypothetical protein VGM54_17465 [Chthoniobacter sp.]
MNVASVLPQFVRDMLSTVPRHGEGVHKWLFRTARVLHPYRPETEIFATLEASVHGCGRTVTAREITDAIRASKPFAWQPGSAVQASSLPGNNAGWKPAPCLTGNNAWRSAPQRRWPQVNREQREAITKGGPTLHDLWDLSPIHIRETAPGTEEIIDTLFPGNPWLCVGASQSVFKTRRREALRGELAAASFIVPSPMTARTGKTREGRMSEHTLASTGPRRFLVVEFDTGSADEHAALLLHLARYAPLTLAVHSAGKSLHGWFYCHGQPEEVMLRFMQYAVSLGADDQLWVRSQFARMPDGTRDPGTPHARRQCVYYFNPACVTGATAISESSAHDFKRRDAEAQRSQSS